MFSLMYLNEQEPDEILAELYLGSRLLLHKHKLVDELTTEEITRLYKTTCTRKCHSSDVVESRPRTALEWDWIMARMKSPDRAHINDHQATTITRYLQEHYLSNVPTILPEKTMRFVKRHLWQSDFGENDIYLDVIYLPNLHRSLLPYLIATNSPPTTTDSLFIVFINTHQGEIPPWDLVEMAMLRNGGNSSIKPTGWKVVYEDGQGHHKQGILSFPTIEDTQSTILNLSFKLPGIRERIFQWNLPIPPYREISHVEN